MEIANFGWFWGSKKIKSSWWLRNSCLYPSWDACGFHLVGNGLETPRKHVASLVSFFNVTHYGVHESSESMWRSAWVSANVRLWFIALFCECSVEHDWIGITQIAKWSDPRRDTSMVPNSPVSSCFSILVTKPGMLLSSLTAFETYLASTSVPLVHVLQDAVVPVYTVRYIESW